MASAMLKFNRVFKTKQGEIGTQPILIAQDEIAVVRPSNRLGHGTHHSTVTMKSGKDIELMERFTVVNSFFVKAC